MAEQQCACGCGQVILKGVWVPGHDHRAIHSRIAQDHGSVAAFIDWYDYAIQKVAATSRGRGRKKPETPRNARHRQEVA